MKRLAIYFFYDKNGIVREYVTYFLSHLKEYCDELCVVVNAPLDEHGEKCLKNNCDRLLVRDNVGFDAWAYKHAIESYGYNLIKQYDELVLCNFTSYGPIHPFEEMFQRMGTINCDFWGLNRHPSQNVQLGKDKNSAIVSHIQSHFMVFRKSLLEKKCFQRYWETLSPINSYIEAIVNHELRCTQYFERLGFLSETYLDSKKYDQKINGNASILCADTQLIEDRSPLLKRKVFFIENEQWLDTAIGHVAADCLDYIQSETDYDVNLILQDLIETQKMSTIRNSLHLNYFLSKNRLIETAKVIPKCALILFVYYEDLVEYCLKYVQSMPSSSRIYIVSAKKDLLSVYEKSLKEIGVYSVETRLTPNKGRDVAAFLVCCSDVYEQYDYICCMHDKKTEQLSNRLKGEEFAYHCFENNLASSIFVQNVLSTFRDNPKLGMLVPPTIAFADYYPLLGNEMTINRKYMEEVYTKLNLRVPFDDAPVAAFGSMFWVRGKAFKSIFNYSWDYDDFPKEPLPADGSISHGLERMYQMSVQNDGYYVGWLATEQYAKCFSDNMVYMLSRLNKVLVAQYGWHNFRTILRCVQFNGQVGLKFKIFQVLVEIHSRYFSRLNPVWLKKLVKKVLLD